jgi:hypothetical protein
MAATVIGKGNNAPAVILVPCAEDGRAGCAIVRRAVDLVAAQAPEVIVAAPHEIERGPRTHIIAVDASTACQASAALREEGIRPSTVISAPEVLARSGLLRPGMEVRAHLEELAAALAAAVRESVQVVLEEVRERGRYRQEMAPVMQRFQGIWNKVESLPPPDGVPSAEEAVRVDLLGKRARNLFVRFDEIVPPSEWAEEHDLFQDALLCIAYACEGWVGGEGERWERNMEKARAQASPLLRRLAR